MTPNKPMAGTAAQRCPWLQQTAVAVIRFYQIALRPLNPWGCKFHPSCSHYALEAIERHGPRRGLWLALQRVGRCRPGVFGGFDPVPLDSRWGINNAGPLAGRGKTPGQSRSEPACPERSRGMSAFGGEESAFSSTRYPAQADSSLRAE